MFLFKILILESLCEQPLSSKCLNPSTCKHKSKGTKRNATSSVSPVFSHIRNFEKACKIGNVSSVTVKEEYVHHFPCPHVQFLYLRASLCDEERAMFLHTLKRILFLIFTGIDRFMLLSAKVPLCLFLVTDEDGANRVVSMENYCQSLHCLS
ncbi:uncharacterized protein A4U43_C07F15220 [Asparagus officinalis]|uniref:Uncharacterized protein n=1 Tax=Asparagus officinalis TaxID=4686 RepID=A0A5P1ECA6_ASPOF|nr:uncharacterized protein A4U43_C07F15220 [Asparagus officinalis]